MKSEEYNILGNILNTTWGVGSTNNPRGASMSLKGQLLGEDQLLLSYSAVMSFGSPQERSREFDRMKNESESIMDAALKKIKSDFKSNAGRTLKFEQLSDNGGDWTLLSLGQYSGKRDAYYIRKIVLQMT